MGWFIGAEIEFRCCFLNISKKELYLCGKFASYVSKEKTTYLNAILQDIKAAFKASGNGIRL